MHPSINNMPLIFYTSSHLHQKHWFHFLTVQFSIKRWHLKSLVLFCILQSPRWIKAQIGLFSIPLVMTPLGTSPRSRTPLIPSSAARFHPRWQIACWKNENVWVGVMYGTKSILTGISGDLVTLTLNDRGSQIARSDKLRFDKKTLVRSRPFMATVRLTPNCSHAALRRDKYNCNVNQKCKSPY